MLKVKIPPNPISGFRVRLRKQMADLPEELGEIAVQHFRQNFEKQGFEGQRWAEVQRRKPGTKAYRYGTLASRTNPILHGKGPGKLNHSIKVISVARNKIVVATTGALVNKYANLHNVGRGRLKQRKFMGMSKRLGRKFINAINKRLRAAAMG